MHTGSYINGKWFHPKSDRMMRNINPATGELIAEFPEATDVDAHKAIECAEKAFPSWKNTPAPERGRVLWRAANLVRQRMDEIAETMTKEEGKTFEESKGEVLKGLALLEYYSGEGFRMGGKTLPSEVPDVFAYTIRRPLGVVGLITPWNFPWANPLWKSAPALVAGNTVVFKPAELTPATASLLVDIYEKAGMPPGVFNMVVGRGSVVGEAIVTSKTVKAISFTGSNAVGNAVNVKAAALGKKVTCELGGKNALIVLSDADLDKATDAIIGGAFGSTGQRCTATSRVIVTPEVKSALLERLVSRVKKIQVGDGMHKDIGMGPAVDEKQLKTDLNYIEIAKKEGAHLVIGGNRPKGLEKGCFVEATIFDQVTPNMRIFQEEVFGPVLSICTAKNLDEALKFANSVQFGLTSSLFTKDMDSVMRYVEEIETGMVHINEPTIGGEAQLPFGGHKATGIGEREMSEEGLNFFTETKTVFINHSKSAARSMIR
jgi:alpha-ketoglutaric semialdehyde dehydrogenase